MAKDFAKLDDNNVVLSIVSVDDTKAPDESTGVAHLKRVFGWDKWKMVNIPTRKNYPMVGGTYNEEANAFVGTKPYNSWTLNTTTYQYEAPSAKPEEDNSYKWNEATLSWDKIPDYEAPSAKPEEDKIPDIE